MTEHPINPRLQSWIRYLERTGWAAFVLDDNYRVVWVSDELNSFLEASEPEELGIGKHMIEAFFLPAWSSRMQPDSQVELFNQVVPYLLSDEELKRATLEHVPDHLAGHLEGRGAETAARHLVELVHVEEGGPARVPGGHRREPHAR